MSRRRHETWLQALSGHAGPLLAAAERLLQRRLPDGSFPRGREGLRELATLMEITPAADDAQAEHDFVDGCGALLGLLLLDHHGHGHHIEHEGTHRIRLGRFGDFDPFDAIHQSLEADDLRGTLAQHVARAEAEAQATGPLSRVLSSLRAQLPEHAPRLTIRGHFEHRVWLHPEGELDLRQVLRSTDGEDAAQVDAAVRKLLQALAGNGPLRSWSDARSHLMPRLVSDQFAAELGQRAEDLWLQPLAGNVQRSVQLRFPDRSRYVRFSELRQWGVSVEQAWHAAIENLAAYSRKARFARVDTTAGPLVVGRSGDGLDAARLLLPALHDVLAPQLGSPFLASVPHRDLLLACAVEPPALVDSIRSRAREEAQRAPHAISQQLFLVDGSTPIRAPR